MGPRPWIGITTYGRNELGEYRLFAQYVESVRRAGGLAFLLPPGEERPEEWLDRLDGVVVTGGGDLEPRHYAGPTHDALAEVDAERDETELRFLRALLERRLPTLAICRGMQLLNVVQGGTLHVHLPEVFADAVAHRGPERNPVAHLVHCEPSSSLALTLGCAELAPLSWHHQCLDQLGEGIEVIARAPDGVVEAVQLRGHDRLAAVQWHPELTAHADGAQQRLFDRLVEQARDAERR